MNGLQSYAIAYKGLSDGSHRYGFVIGDDFFRAFEGTDIRGGELAAEVDFTRRGSLMILDIAITGRVTVECDRCLEDVSLPIDYRGELNVRVGDEGADDDSDVMWIAPGEDRIELAQYIYESVYLGLPFQRVHSGDESCDPDMLSRFGVAEADEDENETVGGTQWEKLEELKRELEEKEE